MMTIWVNACEASLDTLHTVSQLVQKKGQQGESNQVCLNVTLQFSPYAVEHKVHSDELPLGRLLVCANQLGGCSQTIMLVWRT